MIQKKLAAGAVLLLWIVMQVFYPLTVRAEALPGNNNSKKTVTVAFPQVEGYSMTDENGKRSGIFYDFLLELAKYTGWSYEFVTGDVEELNQAVISGKISLMGGSFYRDYMAKQVGYPNYDMGYVYSLLLADNRDESIQAYDLNTIKGKRIGVFDKAYNKIEELKKYLKFNEINCEIVSFSTSDEYETSLEEHKVDLLLGSDISKKEHHKVVGRFVSEPIYIITSMKETELLEELNDGLNSIYNANPAFADELYSRYFPEYYNTDFLLTKQENDYVTGNRIIRVAMMKERYPLNFYNNKEEKGITKDILKMISEKTGFVFEYYYTDTYYESIQAVLNGQADLVGHFMENEIKAEDMGLMSTAPYTSLDEIVIKNKKSVQKTENLTAAMPEGRTVSGYLDTPEMIVYKTYQDCLKAINKGQADMTYIPFAFAEEIFQINHYSNLVIFPVNDTKLDVSFAMPRDGNPMLYHIFSKAIHSMSDSEKSHIVSDNQMFLADKQVTIGDLIYSNPLLVILAFFVMVVCISSIILIRGRYRLKSKLMEGEMKQIEAASAAKLGFLSRMSHELRTPMNAIIGLTKLAQLSGEATESISDKLDKIDISSQYLLLLLNDILDMSKIESSKMKIITQPFRMKELARELESMMRIQADNKGLHFSVECLTGDAVYISDMLRLKQVLMNLLSNAMKFTDAGGTVKMKIEERGYELGGDFATVYFEVQDTGVGIRKEDLSKIFGLFEQVGESAGQNKGTGLGLAISSNLVRLLGGDLEVESEEGEGSTFYFTLIFPYGRFNESLVASKRKSLNQNQDENTIFKNMRLLLVEDNELNAEITMALLAQKDIAAEHVENGKEALDIYQSRPSGYYSAILMDIQMPVMNGFEATDKIRKSSKKDAGTIPIIAMTANTFQEDRDQAAACGMTDFVPKPFKIEELYEVLLKSGNN